MAEIIKYPDHWELDRIQWHQEHFEGVDWRKSPTKKDYDRMLKDQLRRDEIRRSTQEEEGLIYSAEQIKENEI